MQRLNNLQWPKTVMPWGHARQAQVQGVKTLDGKGDIRLLKLCAITKAPNLGMHPRHVSPMQVPEFKSWPPRMQNSCSTGKVFDPQLQVDMI